MITPKTPARLATEARKARMRYQDRGAFAGSSEASEQACWEEAVRPLVEEIERLRSEPQAHDLTPSEVALAKILAAWEEWLGKNSEANEEVAAMAAVGSALVSWGFAADDKPTTKGRALLDRARKAGVL